MNNAARIGRITVGGQPAADELHNYSLVVNVRLPDEAGNTTAAAIAGTGTAYYEEPLTADTLAAEHVARIRAKLDAAGGEVLIH